MTDFSKPTDVSDVLMAFPGDVRHLMPAMDDIPDEFKIVGHPWVRWQNEWFHQGLKKLPTPKPDIDLVRAIRHLACIQGSFQPKHEHKMAAVGYLASLWFDNQEGDAVEVKNG